VGIQAWWIWAVLTALFITVELIRRSFFVWLGFASAVSCILSLLNTPFTGQIAVFVNLSGILILLEQRFKERYRFKTPQEMGESKETETDKKINTNIFRRTGPVWEVVFNGDSFTIKHSIGLSHIRNLLIKQNQWVSCTELKNISSGMNGSVKDIYGSMSHEQLSIENLTHAGNLAPEDVIDRLSIENIRKMRELLKEKIDSDNFDDPEERMQIINSIDFLDDYLRKNIDIHGRSRKLSDRGETDRKAVSAAINRARNSLKEQRELYTHFKSFIQAKGNSFRYLPDRPINWIVE
jgi:membrane protein implicated in regulation of membrane protease activity